MKRRRLFLPLVLSMVLLGAQQMAWLHALSHVGGGRTAASQASQVPAEKVCDQCLAFAQLASALARSSLAFFTDPVAVERTPSGLRQAPAAGAFTAFQSRAPPRSP